jgi:altronate dehydratase
MNEVGVKLLDMIIVSANGRYTAAGPLGYHELI